MASDPQIIEISRPVTVRWGFDPRYFLPYAVVIAALLGIWAWSNSTRREKPITSVTFQGQQFKTRITYPNFAAYEEDENNLAEAEYARVERLMTNATLPPSFRVAEEFVKRSVDLFAFPGYPPTASNIPTDDGSKIIVQSFEIPHRERERWVVALSTGGEFVLVDDFIFSTETNRIERVVYTNGTLRYCDGAGVTLREKLVK